MCDPPAIKPPPPITVRTDYFDMFEQGMYDNARWQISQQQFAAGVLLAQVAVEMGSLNACTSLIVRRDGPVDDAMTRERVPTVMRRPRDPRRSVRSTSAWASSRRSSTSRSRLS